MINSNGLESERSAAASAMTSSAKLDVVIVSYNSKNELAEMWLDHDLEDHAYVVVVDNGSADDSVDLAKRFANKVVLNQNEGLSKANNRGAAVGSADYVLFCNPDVRISRADALKLCAKVDETNGLVAPRLVGRDGLDQPNARSFPSPLRQLAHRVRPQGSVSTRYLWPNQVDWVTGAAIAMRRSHFDAIGGWPDDIFLYFEDVEICFRAHEKGIPVTVAEDVRVTHNWAKDSGRLLSRALRRHIGSAVKYYIAHPRHLFLF